MEISESAKILVVRMLLFTGYVLVGAAIFQALESQKQVEETKRVQNIRMDILRKYNVSDNDARRWMDTFPSTSLGNEDFLEWNYGNSFLFAMVVLTTIGFGNIVPKTVAGRLFCILYALIGIPGTCLTLKAVGDKIAEKFATLITAFEKRLLKRPHPRNVELKVAITTIILTVFFLLPFCSLIVKLRHDQWTYLECFYFTFITLSTIGFGDYLPKFKNDADYLLVVSAFVGLAFVSSIFCSMNNVLEKYGVSVRIVRSLREKSTEGEPSATNPPESPTNKTTECNRNGVHDTTNHAGVHEAGNHTSDASLQRVNLDVIGEDHEVEEMPLTNVNNLTEERKDSRKRGSSTISLGMFTC